MMVAAERSSVSGERRRASSRCSHPLDATLLKKQDVVDRFTKCALRPPIESRVKEADDPVPLLNRNRRKSPPQQSRYEAGRRPGSSHLEGLCMALDWGVVTGHLRPWPRSPLIRRLRSLFSFGRLQQPISDQAAQRTHG